ncbi:methionyl-tRNA formyltransferase [Isosphaeraceae bacterium EP7]
MPTKPRLVMFGTGDFALPTFELLCESGHDVRALVTQPDRPQGRKQELIPSRIKQYALGRGIPVFQPEDVNAADSLAHIAALTPDLFVTAAYGQILSADLLGIPPLGGVNLHGSILPSYRGAAPVARAIQNGETEAGVTVIRMTPRIDAGGMIAVARTPVDPAETAGELEDRLSRIGAPLIVGTIPSLVDGTAQVLPQRKSKVTRAPKLRKDDGLIDWTKSAQEVHNQVRAMQPWPGASTPWKREGIEAAEFRLMIHKTEVDEAEGQRGEPGTVLEALGDRFVIAAGRGAVSILVVQMAGRKSMPAADFLRGFQLSGERLG